MFAFCFALALMRNVVQSCRRQKLACCRNWHRENCNCCCSNLKHIKSLFCRIM